MKTHPIITCGHCCGTGKVTLQRDLLRTFARIEKAKKPLTTLDLIEEGVGATAINNRLVKLQEHGLVEQAGKEGRRILWRTKEKQPEAKS